MKNKENNWEKYPQAQTHIEKYPDPAATPYRIDVFTNGSLERDGSGMVAKVYGKTEEEVIKNSNIICASPDMYEAICNALRFHNKTGQMNTEIRMALLDAVEKAQQKPFEY